MDIGLLVYLLLALTSTGALLASPYLRITSLGWFIAIWCLPYLGALFFILTVVRARTTGHNDAYNTLCEKPNTDRSNNKDLQVFERLGLDYNFLPYFHLANPSVLEDDDFIQETHKLIDHAKQRIWITTYILSGQVKNTLISKLADAHNRGVDVRLLIDRVGSSLLFTPRENPLKDYDIPFKVSVLHQSRIKSLLFVEKRLHSKIVLADKQALIGAHNLRDEILSRHHESVHNISLRFGGSVIKQVEAVFCDLWQMNTKEKIILDNAIPQEKYAKETIPARIIFSDPIERSHKYNRYLSVLFHAARKRICIWMPYVIPTQAMRSTIIGAAKIGLDVRVLMPKKSDSILVDNAHYLVLREFTDNGVECAVSGGNFDHSKILIIDDITIIGSTNLDYRSLYRNYEANIEINNQEFTQSILNLFDQQYTQAQKVSRCNKPLIIHMKNQLTSLIAGLY